MAPIRFCINCNGDGKVKCPLCDGKGTRTKRGGLLDLFASEKIECEHCRGTGVVLCEVCKGMGKIEDVREPIRTVTWPSRPRVIRVAQVERSITEVQLCHGCGGRGTLTCPVCRGKGTLKKRSQGFSGIVQPIDTRQSRTSSPRIVLSVDDTVECDACQGTGKILCKLCGGVGKITVTE